MTYKPKNPPPFNFSLLKNSEKNGGPFFSKITIFFSLSVNPPLQLIYVFLIRW